jgi:fructokinase
MDGVPPPAGPVLCIGEVLWDVFADRRLLGGAPFNVACHLCALGQEAAMLSRVGDDALGHEILAQAKARGLAALIQVDCHAPTGQVTVTLGDDGSPTYVIHAPAAWDAIEPTPAAVEAAAHASAIVFGSLAHRADRSRTTIGTLLESPALKVFDVNLRPPHDNRAVVEDLLRRSDIVKLNDDEIRRLAAWFGLPDSVPAACAEIAGRFGPRAVCVTLGARGAALWSSGRWTEQPGHAVEVCDTVGAGDAFLAAFLALLMRGADAAEALAWANAAGAFVAAQPGAVPPLDLEALRTLVETVRPSPRPA